LTITLHDFPPHLHVNPKKRLKTTTRQFLTPPSEIMPPSHPFVPPAPYDRRSPCPALNALSNHGYLPHDGKNIGFFALIRAQQEVYNLSYPLAFILALAGVILCGSFGKLNLDALSIHNRIEHDSSLVHNDASSGDASSVIPKLVDELVADSADGVHMTFNDLVRARVRRQEHLAVGQLDELHAELARGESVLAHDIFLAPSGTGASVEHLKIWFGEERLPDGWVRPQHAQGLLETMSKAKKFKGLVKELQANLAKKKGT